MTNNIPTADSLLPIDLLILNDYLAFANSYADADSQFANADDFLAELDYFAPATPIDNDDDPDYSNAFYLSMNFDDCPIDIIAFPNRDRTALLTTMISIDSSEYAPMTPRAT